MSKRTILDPASPGKPPKRALTTPSTSVEEVFSSLQWEVKPFELVHRLIAGIEWPEMKAHYDLAQLIPKDFVFNESEYRDSASNSKKGEDQVAQWVAHMISPQLDPSVAVTTDRQTNFLKVPELFFSQSARADVCVETSPHRLPLLCIQVHSHNGEDGDGSDDDDEDEHDSYMDTLAKTVVMLIYQLRALRNYDDSIKQVCGFTFPKLGRSTALTKTLLSWQGLQFHVQFQVLETEEAARATLATCLRDWIPPFSKQLSKFGLLPKQQALNILPLSREDLDLFGASHQIGSNSAIVVYCPPKPPDTKGEYLKYNPTWRPQWETNVDANDVIVPVKLKVRRGIPFDFAVSTEHTQLSVKGARAVKYEFVRAVAKSLSTLHHVHVYAHLDVRLPNICYDDGIARFIDFDRSDHVWKPASLLKTLYGDSIMYAAPAGWTMEQVDWRQFGLLIAELEGFEVDAAATTLPSFSGSIGPLLESLIGKGSWCEEAYLNWIPKQD